MAAETGNGFVPEPHSLTGRDNYFEDFNVGEVYDMRAARPSAKSTTCSSPTW